MFVVEWRYMSEQIPVFPPWTYMLPLQIDVQTQTPVTWMRKGGRAGSVIVLAVSTSTVCMWILLKEKTCKAGLRGPHTSIIYFSISRIGPSQVIQTEIRPRSDWPVSREAGMEVEGLTPTSFTVVWRVYNRAARKDIVNNTDIEKWIQYPLHSLFGRELHEENCP